jgi:hypothetical protein
MGQTTILSETIDRFNSDTGEITSQTRHKVFRNNIAPTDEFIKVSKYLNTIFAYNGIPLNLVGISLILAQRMEYKTNIVYLLKSDKVEIGDMLGLKRRLRKNGYEDTNTVDKLLRDCKKYDIIRPTQTRGKYEVNGFLFSTGNIADTRKLQLHFDLDSDTYLATAEQKNRITGEVVRKSVTNAQAKGQIKGQMSLEDMMGGAADEG